MAFPLNPNSKRQRIIAMLHEGPVMTNEVAAELGISIRLASAHLTNIRNLGMVSVKRCEVKPESAGTSYRHIWSLVA
jgi:predicted ArsR family transcriptional regulator